MNNKTSTDMSVFTYQYVDLPSVPNTLLTAAEKMVNDPNNDTWLNNPVIKSNHGKLLYDAGKFVGSSTMFQCKKFTTEYDTWVKKNILCDPNIKRVFKYAGITANKPGHDFSGPHTDSSRNYVLMYLIKNPHDKNNNPQITKFWKKKKHVVTENSNNDFANFELIDQVVFPLYQWILMNGQCFHSVSNISQGRISLQIGLDRQPLLRAKELNLQ